MKIFVCIILVILASIVALILETNVQERWLYSFGILAGIMLVYIVKYFDK